ncbi:hypothetical protein UFOVP107_7 [uncultured Caudovirales phage]|uniref:Uncharacterized protein n=1 Tax=uncultured Caudovirales phage TaxID=2100421 RepID=A0A6J7WP58_9CAUD|nr:hypothetical protein UFOVP107_7 [uncultured Caudovirales phage]CAB5218648.1 hypothetical protein UFOVP214_44 [uncultured Caudovirales phage]
MRVKLHNSLARMVNGRMVIHTGGDVVDVTTSEGTRMIATNRATLVPDDMPAIDVQEQAQEQAPVKRVRRLPKE